MKCFKGDPCMGRASSWPGRWGGPWCHSQGQGARCEEYAELTFRPVRLETCRWKHFIVHMWVRGSMEMCVMETERWELLVYVYNGSRGSG